jgi:hypothetical protein
MWGAVGRGWGIAIVILTRDDFMDKEPGLSGYEEILRDVFAAIAFHQMMSGAWTIKQAEGEELLTFPDRIESYARSSFEAADAMLTARNTVHRDTSTKAGD